MSETIQLRYDKEHGEKVDEPGHRKESGVISIHGLSHRYGESEVLQLPERG